MKESAFPHEWTNGKQDQFGLTKLEWYAGMALQGLFSNHRNTTFMHKVAEQHNEQTPIVAAQMAFDAAQAMLDEAEKRQKDGQ